MRIRLLGAALVWSTITAAAAAVVGCGDSEPNVKYVGTACSATAPCPYFLGCSQKSGTCRSFCVVGQACEGAPLASCTSDGVCDK